MKGLRRNDAAMKYLRWYYTIVIFHRNALFFSSAIGAAPMACATYFLWLHGHDVQQAIAQNVRAAVAFNGVAAALALDGKCADALDGMIFKFSRNLSN